MIFKVIDHRTAEYIFNTMKTAYAPTSDNFVFEGPSMHKYIDDVRMGNRIDGVFHPNESIDHVVILELISLIKISIEDFVSDKLNKKLSLNSLIFLNIKNNNSLDLESVYKITKNFEFRDIEKNNDIWGLLFLNDSQDNNSVANFSNLEYDKLSGKIVIIDEGQDKILKINDFSEYGPCFVAFSFKKLT